MTMILVQAAKFIGAVIVMSASSGSGVFTLVFALLCLNQGVGIGTVFGALIS